MKELVFNSEQKQILLELLKTNFGTQFDHSLYHQMYKVFSETDRHWFTVTWSRQAYIALGHGYFIFKTEDRLYEDWEFNNLCGIKSPKPKTSKKYKLWKDLITRIREPWDNNETYQIIFK